MDIFLNEDIIINDYFLSNGSMIRMGIQENVKVPKKRDVIKKRVVIENGFEINPSDPKLTVLLEKGDVIVIQEKDKWIPKDLEKGGLHKDLGIDPKEKIPTEVLDTIIKAETGDTISVMGKSIKVTTELQQRANFAKNVRK